MATDENETRARNLGEKFAYVESQIRARGETIKPGSRQDRERRLFLDANGNLRTVNEDEPCFLDAIEALRDYTLFEYILERWPFRDSDTLASSKLKLALKDAVDPYVRDALTRGRDTQVELFAATMLHRGRARVRFEEPVHRTPWPDFRTRFNGIDLYVDAKRPKSPTAILDSVEHGVSQVAATKSPGALFVDVSMAFNPTRGLVTRLMPDDEFRRAYFEALRRGIRPLEQSLFRAMDGTRVTGVAFQDHQGRKHPVEGWKLESCCMHFPNPAVGAVDVRMWKKFVRSLNRA